MTLPLHKNENYRFSKAHLLAKELGAQSTAGLKVPADLDRLEGEDAHWILGSALSGLDWETESTITSLPKVFEDDVFAMAVAEHSAQGHELRIPAGAKGTLRITDPGHTYSSLKVNVGEGAKVDLSFLQVGHTGRCFSLVELAAEASAQVHLTHVQATSGETSGAHRFNIRLERDAQVTTTLVGLGGATHQTRVEAQCQGQGSEFRLLGACLAQGKQVHDYWLSTSHEAPHSISHMNHWMVLKDEAQGVFNGQLIIPQSAPHCEGYQNNRNLILGTKAKVDALPKLEISVDEVKCSHGSATSSLEEEQLNYMMSRGLDRRQAEELLVHGFFEQGLEHLYQPGLKTWILHRAGLKTAEEWWG